MLGGPLDAMEQVLMVHYPGTNLLTFQINLV